MKKLMSMAAGLAAMAILAVGGRGQDGPIGCGDVPQPAFKIHLERTLGVDGSGGVFIADVDGSKLSAEQVKQLRKLIEDAHYFDLPSTDPVGPHIPEAPPGYNLTVEMDGRTHSIWTADRDVSKPLLALIDALTLRGEPQLKQVPAAAGVNVDPVNDWLRDSVERKPAPGLVRVEKEEPAIRIDFMETSTLSPSRRTANINSAALSAEDAHKLARLVADARFFDQPEQFPPSNAPDGSFYSIMVETNGKRHTVSVSWEQIPVEMKPLIDWLSGRAVEEEPIGCELPYAM